MDSACGGKAYDTLLAEVDKRGPVDTAKKVAIGYCAGGFALEQARAGADFKAASYRLMRDFFAETL